MLSAFLILVGSATAYAEDGVALRTATEVRSAAIKLSDVFTGVPEGIDRDIATAPVPGKSVTYDVNVLKKLAEHYRLDWAPQSLGDRAVLTRAATRITADMIREAVVAKLTAQDVKGKVEVVFDNHALEVDLPVERAPDFALNNFNYDAMSKRFRADLLAENGAGGLSLPVTGRVTVKIDVPVPAHRMEAGTTVGAADIDWLTVADDHAGGDMLTDAAQLIGHETRHDLAAGQPVHARDIMPARLVVRGSLVTLKIETPMMLITAQGRALQDGAVGETVRVTNTQSNRVVEGVVEASGLVRITTGQKMAAVE